MFDYIGCGMAGVVQYLPIIPKMASCSAAAFQQMKLFLGIPLLVVMAIISGVSGRCFDSIFSFGDSLADTGNILYVGRPDKHSTCIYRPYGQTFFHRPTGRCSDGRLVIDFIAEQLGMPLVPPYFGSSGGGMQLRNGVNFAVAGATALDAEFFSEMGVESVTNISLRVQIGLFKDMFASLCTTSSDCSGLFRNSLFLMGEIGGNDYNHHLRQGKTIEEVKELVPLVTQAIASAINELVQFGAVTLLVPGNLPIGCIPLYLTMFKSSNKQEYDPLTGCFNKLNEFSQYHNEILMRELNQIRKLHPHANIVYADYYNAAMRIYRSPDQFGFTGGVLQACCGAHGPYNFDASAFCGSCLETKACYNSSLYVSWDGLHFTEATYKQISKAILGGSYTSPRMSISCSTLANLDGEHYNYE